MIGPDGKVDEQQLTPFLQRVKTDTKIGTGWAEVVQWAIIVTCATVLFSHGVTNITTAAQAASALKPLAGDYARSSIPLVASNSCVSATEKARFEPRSSVSSPASRRRCKPSRGSSRVASTTSR